MKVAGVMAISDFILAPLMADDLARRCDMVVLRFDAINGSKTVFNKCVAAASFYRIPVYVVRSKERWNRWNWREQMLRRLDSVKPDYVLAPDSDEKFDQLFDQDFRDFVESGRDIMMFDYVMATMDGRPVPKYPGARHCKAFRWVSGLGYRPYGGYARPTWPGRSCVAFNAQTPIHHYCFYSPEMEQWKLNNLHK